MKKLICCLSIMGFLMAAVQAQAIVLGHYHTGALVPSVYHDGKSMDTVIGITCQFNCSEPTTPNAKPATGKIHWVFYDVDSNHVASGWLTCTDNDLVGFSWANERPKLAGESGYLVFRAQQNPLSDEHNVAPFKITANAFLVDTSTNDAVFIPVVPVDLNEFKDHSVNTNDNVIANLDDHGIQENTIVDARYWIDPQYDANTTIIVWLTDRYINEKGKPIGMEAYVFNADEEPADITMFLPHELNKLCPSCWKAVPEDFVDGFVEFVLPASGDGFVYSYISSSFFAAQQTLLAGEVGNAVACGWNQTEKNPPEREAQQPSCGNDNTGSGQ